MFLILKITNINKKQIFDRLRETSPEVLEKVIAISTDFETDDLDISDDNKSIIKREVEVCMSVN